MDSVLTNEPIDDLHLTSQCSVRSGSSHLKSVDESSLKSVSQCSAEPSQIGLPDSEEEYTTQFFGFTAKSFCSGMYNAIDSFVEDNLELLTDFLLQQFPNDLSQESAKAMRECVRSKFISKMDKNFDKLESYLGTNLMRVPEHVLLPEDAPHALGDPGEEEERAVDEEIKRLSDRIWRLKYANSLLRDEVRVTEEAQSRSDAILSRFAVVDQVLKDTKVSDLRESLRFTLSRAQRCLELVNTVQGLAAQAGSPISAINQVSPLRAEVDTILKFGGDR